MADSPPRLPKTGAPSPSLSARIGALLTSVDKDLEKRRRATARTMEEVDRRLRHIAFLIADLDLRYVIPKLTELASMFPQATQPKKEGVCDRISLDFLPTREYPAQARVCVGMTPLSSAEKLRVTLSVVMLPVHLPYEHESWIDLTVENPDTRRLEGFLDDKLMQFVKDYVRVRDPESAYHEDQRVTDPVCQMTFSITEAASSTTWKDRTYYFCVEGCRRKFEMTPERYILHPVVVKDLPSHEQSPLLQAGPGEERASSKTRHPKP
jgi:YHS domain-containing protein